MDYNKETSSLTFWRGSEVSQEYTIDEVMQDYIVSSIIVLQHIPP